jgi:peroxiredoxin
MKIKALLFIWMVFTSVMMAQFPLADDRGYFVKVGDQSPDFTVTLADGKTFKLSAQKGKVVMLQFTASWCGVCRQEMPHIESRIWKPYKDKGLVVVGVDRDEPLETLRSFAKQTGITYPLALDPKADVFGLYADKQAGVTRNVLIDRNGKIVFLTRLYDENEFNRLIETIVKQINSK